MVLALILGCADLGIPASEVDPEDPRFAGLGSSGGSELDPSDTGASYVVVMRGLSFETEELTVFVGDQVTWVNEDTAFHIIAQGEPGDDSSWVSPPIQVGQSWTKVFEEPGDVVYFCDNHERVMRDAIIHVVE